MVKYSQNKEFTGGSKGMVQKRVIKTKVNQLSYRIDVINRERERLMKVIFKKYIWGESNEKMTK